ncbi:MAG: DNA/RNA non-specific endonuclease [Myxococcales bacterium]|nr:DNA/RNA non-specific endonuclease [Myxococcales bacterium]
MNRSDAPQGEAIDEGSHGQLGAPPPGDAADHRPRLVAVPLADAQTRLAAQGDSPQRIELTAGAVRIEITVSVDPHAGATLTGSRQSQLEPEKVVRPWTDPDYSNRSGYDPEFLGTRVPMPTPHSSVVLARLADGGHELKYQNFSVLMHKERRLCMVTAANVDNAPRRRRPDLSRTYGRAALGGLGPKDGERWFTDPRLPEQDQLPDRFFTKDGGAFDRGHVVMRESVCWGKTYTDVRRANGDTYHTTNCTPQVAGFNQSSKLGRWGQLENELGRRLAQGRMTVFAGPMLADDDWWFEGVDDQGDVRVQIPSRFWKVAVGRREGELVAFAFRLEQDLRQVPLEEELGIDPEAWIEELVSVQALEDEIGTLRFAEALKAADQVEEELGLRMRTELGLAPER